MEWEGTYFLKLIENYLLTNYQKLTKWKKKFKSLSESLSEDYMEWFFFQNLLKSIYFQELLKIKKKLKKKLI